MGLFSAKKPTPVVVPTNPLVALLKGQEGRLREGTTLESVKVVFFDEAARLGEHGALQGSFHKEKIEDGTISFFFVNMLRPPKLSPAILAHIWQEARLIGIIPSHLFSYHDVVVQRAPAQRFQFSDL